MRLLLDTHIALWLTEGGDELSIGERNLIETNSGLLMFSAVSLWELRLKWSSFYRSGERKGLAEPLSVRNSLMALDCQELFLSGIDAVTELRTPLSHKDPFDELLVAQAQANGLRLLTRDARLIAHPLAISG